MDIDESFLEYGIFLPTHRLIKVQPKFMPDQHGKVYVHVQVRCESNYVDLFLLSSCNIIIIIIKTMFG